MSVLCLPFCLFGLAGANLLAAVQPIAKAPHDTEAGGLAPGLVYRVFKHHPLLLLKQDFMVLSGQAFVRNGFDSTLNLKLGLLVPDVGIFSNCWFVEFSM